MSHVAFFGPFFSDSFPIFVVIIKFRRPVIINFCAICRSFLQGTYFAKNLSMKQTEREREDKTSFASQKTFCFVLFSFGRTTREHLTPVLLLSGRLNVLWGLSKESEKESYRDRTRGGGVSFDRSLFIDKETDKIIALYPDNHYLTKKGWHQRTKQLRKLLNACLIFFFLLCHQMLLLNAFEEKRRLGRRCKCFLMSFGQKLTSFIFNRQNHDHQTFAVESSSFPGLYNGFVKR